MISSLLHKTKRAALWLLILLACLLAQLGLLEGTLRWKGYGEPTRFLLRKEINDTAYYVPNRAFYQQFTALPLDRIMTWDDLDFQVPETKAPGVRRVFVFGSSAIYGTRASARILEVLLDAHCPDVDWEVYNTACPGMNSHVMRTAAAACAALEPDVYLVYMGNNEAVGPFGPTTALGRLGPLWRPGVIRFLIWLNGLRVSQLFRANSAMVSLNLPDTDALMGMMPSMTDHHRALLHYADNLEAICNAAEKSGAQAVLCTLSSNKRFMGTVHAEEPDFNGLSINGIVRDLATQLPFARLADVDTTLREHSEDGLPGYEYFYDNVHFNFDGNYLAAGTMMHAVLSLPHRLPCPGEAAAPLMSRDDCALRLAWTDAAEFDLLGWQLQTFQDEHTRERTRERYEALRVRLGDSWPVQMAKDYLAALEYRPDDLYLCHACFKEFLDLGNYDEAQRQQETLATQHPGARVTLRAKALLADRQGDAESAVVAYRDCLTVYPDDPQALKGLGELLYQRGEAAEAQKCYQKFLRSNPDDAFAWCRIGELQHMQGDSKGARQTYEMIIESAPKHPLAHRLLDALLAETLSTEDRSAYWDNVMRTYPEAAEPRVCRALLCLEAGDGANGLSLLREAATLAPDDPAVQARYGAAAYAQCAWDEAETALRAAIRLQPADGQHRLLLVQTLLAKGDLPAATEAHAECEALGIPLPPELRQRILAP